MSRPRTWQTCHKNVFENKVLSEVLSIELRKQELAPGEVASKIDVSLDRVVNWYGKNVGMTAMDLYLLIKHYDFMEEFVGAFALGRCESVIASRWRRRMKK
jgi:hypothetical protein